MKGDYIMNEFAAEIIGILIFSCIFGFVTKVINENKGYDGGYLWGFFLGIIGIIVVACKPSNNSYSNSYAPSGDLWICARCGSKNTGFSCSCGLYKGDSVLLEKQHKEEQEKEVARKNQENKQKNNVQLIKEYKNLLDSGVITQEEFNIKKDELLKL